MIACLLAGIGGSLAQIMIESNKALTPIQPLPQPIPEPSLKITNSIGLRYNLTFENLQKATWDLNASGGGWIRVPACTLTFTHPYYPISHLDIEGTGNETIFAMASSINTNMVILDGKTNVRFAGIKFDMNGANQHSKNNLSVIYQTHACSFISVEHCSFYHGHGSYIYDNWASPSSNVTVDHSQFHAREHLYWQGGISFAGADCIARDNYVEDTWACGIRVHGSKYYTPYPRRCLIEGNYITGTIGHGIHMEYASDCQIINNTIVDLNCSAYKGYDTPDAYSSGILVTSDSLVKGNVIRRVNYRAIASGGNNIIIGNVITDVEDVAGIVGAAGDVISNNYIESNVYPNHPTYGIRVIGPCVIEENMLACRNASRFDIGIYAKAGKSMISNNTVYQSRVGIRTELGQDSVITSNVIDNNTGVAILMFSSPYSMVSGNILSAIQDAFRFYSSQGCQVSNNTIQP
jgi:parallel beta-helix repeat protein